MKIAKKGIFLDSDQILHRCKSEVLQEQVSYNVYLLVISVKCVDIVKVSNLVEGLEQELADITDSGDFAAYQVLIHTIEHFDLDLILTLMILRTLPPFRNFFQTTLAPCSTPTTSYSPLQGGT